MMHHNHFCFTATFAASEEDEELAGTTSDLLPLLTTFELFSEDVAAVFF